ncbi:MAG: ribbon-helix-helix domain-containing protein [Rhodocyclales bacterium]|nr:ribbon-helix-helix domain-containing protein [Rhodocyclales bacterium]
MCKIFISADPELYRCRSRSLRLSGVATSIRLENLFWQVLEEIGARDGLSVAQLITRLYDELAEAGGQGANDSANFSSFLRVSCGRYLALQVSGHIPADTEVPIRSLDADWVLAGEKRPHSGTFGSPLHRPGMTQAAR